MITIFQKKKGSLIYFYRDLDPTPIEQTDLYSSTGFIL